MNVKNLIAAASLMTLSGIAAANEFVQADAGFVSTKTRAEVVAELEQARADGTLLVADNAYPVIEAASTRTRAEVLAELRQARADGTVEVNDASYPVIQAKGPQLDREQVKAELREWLSTGRTDKTYFGGA